jgi:adenosylmethionine-8-amino-7-oxononanoate aminotransferase
MIPLGAMMAREDMGEAFFGPEEAEVQFAHGHTYAGNPLASAVGIAVIEEIVEKNLCEKARVLGDYLALKLEGLKKYGVVREVRGRGVIRGVELVKDTKKMEPFNELGIALKKTALENGLIMRINPNWFAVAPALIATESDIDEMCSLIEISLKQALGMVNK